jgi:hypothetical protein
MGNEPEKIRSETRKITEFSDNRYLIVLNDRPLSLKNDVGSDEALEQGFLQADCGPLVKTVGLLAIELNTPNRQAHGNRHRK